MYMDILQKSQERIQLQGSIRCILRTLLAKDQLQDAPWDVIMAT